MLGSNYTTWVGWHGAVSRKHYIRGFFYSLFVLYFILIQLEDLVFDVKIEFFGAAVIIPSSPVELSLCYHIVKFAVMMQFCF